MSTEQKSLYPMVLEPNLLQQNSEDHGAKINRTRVNRTNVISPFYDFVSFCDTQFAILICWSTNFAKRTDDKQVRLTSAIQSFGKTPTPALSRIGDRPKLKKDKPNKKGRIVLNQSTFLCN